MKEDQPFVLKLLMEAISEVDTNPEQLLVVTLKKFGQKDHKPIKLAKMIDLKAIEAISVHAACTFCLTDYKM